LQVGGAGIQWNGPTTFSSSSETTFASVSETTIASGATFTHNGAFYVDGPGVVYVRTNGFIIVQSTGEISVQTGGHLDIETGGALNWRSGSLSTAASGSTVQFADGSVLNLGGTVNFGGTSEVYGNIELANGNVQFLGTQPTSTADPGANNMACGTNMVKAWGTVRFTGGAATILDGYNIASVAIEASGGNAAVVFARDMANANYAVTYGVGGSAHSRKYATTQGTDKLVSGFKFNVWSEADETNYDLDGGGSIDVSFCVMGRQ
jgi:urease beta subunit